MKVQHVSVVIFMLVSFRECFAAKEQTKRSSLSEKVIDTVATTENYNVTTNGDEYGEFKVIQSNVLQIKSLISGGVAPKSKRDLMPVFGTALATPSSTEPTLGLTMYNSTRQDKQYKHGNKKKKKKHSGFNKLLKKLKKYVPKFLKKMMPMMKGPSMFFLGMAQANLNNFVMHALMMSKWALSSVIIMLIREIVFGDKDQPVKYYNFGYDHYHPVRRRIISTTYHHDFKKRRRRNME